MAHYCKSCEQRFRQNFCKTFDWIAVNPSFVFKSGKQTLDTKNTRFTDFAINLSAINEGNADGEPYFFNF